MKRLWGVAFLLLWAVFCRPKGAECSVVVAGPPEWLADAIRGSIIAVMKEMPSYELKDQERLLAMVSERIFEGYRVNALRIAGKDDVFIELIPVKANSWEADVTFPKLYPPCDEWFRLDSSGMKEEILSLLQGVPVEALRWADEVFLKEVRNIASSRLPGWEPHVMVSKKDECYAVELSFTASQDLVLAIDAHVFSRSLPSFWQYDMREKLLESLSPFIGIPVGWAAKHERDVERVVNERLKDTRLSGTARIEVESQFVSSKIAKANVNVESKRYTLNVWGAAYAGTEDKSTELGLHFGRKAQPLHSWDIELYGEAVMLLDDGDSEERLGFRWSPYKNFWLGAERELEEDKTWYRLWIEGGLKAFYAWWRHSDEHENNAALGYRFTEHLSLELYIDERDDDEVSIRAVGNF
ncbi:hypothetical protein Anamo_0310 [Acetomicrobium mobile DSM 13181]|uniref:Uncharacterized protein n=1 Tax=Acetomicrobium mobile (strain ATCC BAA-54 / DSM 13181 / JCM 12221 / NGA) TaxID=891968 RepID=I4BUL0_ACEMN|nr:hypothetical protein [Acetomicrobium mobile]AFM20967.1 hypothetical protein Anamo_0310 [Acetomicrobium mobile DSM 13181]